MTHWALQSGNRGAREIGERLRGSVGRLSQLFGSGRRRRDRRARRDINRDGWDWYARTWDDARRRDRIPDLTPGRAQHLKFVGDEWSLMDDQALGYGVDVGSVDEFATYLEQRMLSPYLPQGSDLEIMEIGPGGGRVTTLLLPRARTLYAVDLSPEMLRRLQERFASGSNLKPVLTDGIRVDGIAEETLDAVVSFDAFVHMEPWDIFRYLEIAKSLLRPGGVGIIHFSDVETPIGFAVFRAQVPSVVASGLHFATFSVMTKAIMRTFLEGLGLEAVDISNDVIRRDAVAVFRKPESAP